MHTHTAEPFLPCISPTNHGLYREIAPLIRHVDKLLTESMACHTALNDALKEARNRVKQATIRAYDEARNANYEARIAYKEAERATKLSAENKQLKDRLAKLKRTNKRLRCILASQQKKKK
jgi:hypothetical protein